MTSHSSRKPKGTLAAEAFEQKVERAFFRTETVIILDAETVQRICDGRIVTSGCGVPL